MDEVLKGYKATANGAANILARLHAGQQCLGFTAQQSTYPREAPFYGLTFRVRV